MDDRKFVAMTARMEGKSVVARNIGGKRKVSDMELIALCNFARVGLLSIYSNLDGDAGEQAGAELDRLVDAIRTTFAGDGKSDGLNMLSECCVAILGQERLGKYVVA